MFKGSVALVNYLANPIVGGGREVKFDRTLENLRAMGVDIEPFDMWKLDKKYSLFHIFGSEYYLAEFTEVVARTTPVVVTTFFYSIRTPSIFWLLKLGKRLPFLNDIVKSTTWELRRRLIDAAHFLLPNCEAEARQLKKYFNAPEEKMRIVPSGVDLDFKEGKAERFFEKTGLKDFVLCVARVERRKNQLRLLKAMKGTNIKVVLIGPPHPLENSYTLEVEKEVQSDPNFHWLKGLPYSDPLLRDAYKAARVHALPSIFDAPGQSSLQAGLAGINIVVSDIEPVREYVENFAFYVNPFDVRSIREGILKAWETSPSPDLREHIERNFTWEKVAQKTLEVHKEAVSL